MIPYSRAQLARLEAAPRNPVKLAIYNAYLDAIASDAGFRILLKYGIHQSLTFCHFMAQIAHETGGFTILVENDKYSAARIIEVFGVGNHSARVTHEEAARLAGNGPALFERTYGLGNPHKAAELGNTSPGDGHKYRGRGPMETTGRGDYLKLGLKLGIDLEAHPELLEDPLLGLEAAAWEWKEKNCNRWALEDNCAMVTRRINGGAMGLGERETYLARAKSIWMRALPADLPEDSAGNSTSYIVTARAAPQDTPAAPVAVSGSESAPNQLTRPVDPNTISPGATGPRVQVLQSHLKRLGYYPFEPDGDFGDRTIEALLAFKHANALPLSDKVDAATWTALESGIPRDLGVRAHLTEADLREKGSTEIADADMGQQIVKWSTIVFGSAKVAENSGVVDQMKAVADKTSDATSAIKVIAEQAGALITLVSHHALPIIVIVLAGALWLYASKNKARRVKLAQSGLHLGR